MPAMDGMPWAPMCGESWAGAAASFLAMWIPMMAAMMLPSLVPTLWRYHRAIGGSGGSRPGLLTALVGAGYFSVWSALGVVVFPVGAVLMTAGMDEPLPSGALAAAVIPIAGALQLSAWKARHLARCQKTPRSDRPLPADAVAAWRHGLGHGWHCVCSCAGLTAMLLVVGMMDLGAMTAVTAAITAERLAPAGERVARVTGAVALGAGLLLIARAAGLA